MPKKTFFNLPEEKRNRILNGAREEFAHKPYQNVSINRLIEAMDIPIGSFYQYFEDKKDIYFYLLSFYMDSELEESKQTGKKIDLLDPKKNIMADSLFTQSKNLQYYQEFFIDNFNKSRPEIKREWTFNKLIGEKYMEIYNYDFFDQDDIDPMIKKNKDLFMGIILAFPNVIHRFCDLGGEEEWKLYQMCVEVLKQGMVHFKS